MPVHRKDEQPVDSDLLAFDPSISGGSELLESIAESRSLLEQWLMPDGFPMLLVIQHVGSDREGYELQLRRFDGRWLVVWEHTVWY